MASGVFFTKEEMIEQYKMINKELLADNLLLIGKIKAVYPAAQWDKIKDKLKAYEEED